MKTRKVVINACYGRFSPSTKAYEWLEEKGLNLFDKDPHDIPRDHPALVEAVEMLGEKANGIDAKLKVVEIPEDVDWQIKEYDGFEHIAEVHRTWS